MTDYRTVYSDATGEFEDKKSRFICTLSPCASEEEALAFIEAVRKKYRDAKHNCYAYIIGEKGELVRASDDGEPQKTAGAPMLSVLTGENLTNVVCTVTRYFGGTLLGTGGLIRAYTNATTAAVNNARIIEKKSGVLFNLTMSYNDSGKVQFYLQTSDIKILNTDYSDSVSFSVCIPTNDADTFKNKITDLTSGRATVEKKDDVRFFLLGSETVIEQSF